MSTDCLHCGQQSPDEFCCIGCEGAYQLIQNLGLGNYYKNKIINENERPLIPEDISSIEVDRFIEIEGDISSLHLMVEGIHCAACIWLIESVLGQIDGVTYARMNMSTRRLTLKWNSIQVNSLELLKTVCELGYQLHPYDPKLLESQDKEYEKYLLLCMAVAGFTAANVMLFSISIWSGIELGSSTALMFQWISALIVIPAIAFSARPFFTSASNAIKNKHVNMDVPISLAIITAIGISMYDTLYTANETYFDSAITLTFFLLIGRYMEFKTTMKGRSAAERLLSLQASSASVRRSDGSIHIIPVDQIKVGDILLVAKGEKFSADGIIIEGESYVDTSSFTGESLPENVSPQSEVSCGTINLGDSLIVKVTATGKDTVLSHIIKLMDKASQHKSRYVKLSDKVASFYAPVVHGLAGSILVFWWLNGAGFHEASTIAISVLIVTCPCALALAIPTVHTAVGNLFLKRGIILKSPDALEKLRDIDTIVFDKTGTLTTGVLKLISKHSEKELRHAASLSVHSNHPLSKALVKAYGKNKFEPATQIKEVSGKGVQGRLNGKTFKLGNRAFCNISQNNSHQGAEVWLNDGEVSTCFTFEDDLKDDASTTIQALQSQGLDITILSGDLEGNVRTIAEQLAVPYQAACSPEDKFNFLQEQINRGHKVMMIGDGINDAPALEMAHVSISFAYGSDIAQNAADIILQKNELNGVLFAYGLSKKAQDKILKNLGLSLCYNACAIPLAMAGVITPLLAAILMSSSSVLVMLNSIHLLRYKKVI